MMEITKQASRIVRSWVKGQSLSPTSLSEHIKVIFETSVEAMIAADKKLEQEYKITGKEGKFF